MAAFGGQRDARNTPGNIGGLIGLGVDNITGSTKAQKIGGLVNDAFTVFLTGGTTGTLTTILDPSITIGTKAITTGAQIRAYYDVVNNGGLIK